MKTYHKIQSLFKRDPDDGYKSLLIGEYSLPEFEYLKDLDWIATEKVDGMNIRIMWDGEKVRYGGKSDNAQIPTRLYDHLTTFQSKDFAAAFDEPPVCLYGEGYGPGIQAAGKGYGGEPRFILFDVKVGSWWLNRDSVESVAEKMKIMVVPVFHKGPLKDIVEIVRDTPMESHIANCQAEGLVARPAVELFRRNGDRIITKLKVRDFYRGI